jgi:hypothetical protein
MINFPPIRVSLPQNINKLSDSHPDFGGKLEIADEQWSAAEWLNRTKKDTPYLSVHLTCDSSSRKLKLAIWKSSHEIPEDPHFASTQNIDSHTYQLRAWLLPVGDDYRLELTIEAATNNGEFGEISGPLATTKKRIAEFIAESGTAILPENPVGARRPIKKTASSIAKNEDDDGAPDDIPFFSRVCTDVRQSRLNRRVF